MSWRISGRCWVPVWSRKQGCCASTTRCRPSTQFPTSPIDMRHHAAALLLLAVVACGGGGGGGGPKGALRYHPPAGAGYHLRGQPHTTGGAPARPPPPVGPQKKPLP